jgi:hypothetical protein
MLAKGLAELSLSPACTCATHQLLARATRPENLDDTRIEDLIGAFLGPTQTLEILPENELHLALHSFVEKDEKTAIAEYVIAPRRTVLSPPLTSLFYR